MVRAIRRGGRCKAVSHESAEGSERAAIEERTEQDERAVGRESAVFAERAVQQESTVAGERAVRTECTVSTERSMLKSTLSLLQRPRQAAYPFQLAGGCFVVVCAAQNVIGLKGTGNTNPYKEIHHGQTQTASEFNYLGKIGRRRNKMLGPLQPGWPFYVIHFQCRGMCTLHSLSFVANSLAVAMYTISTTAARVFLCAGGFFLLGTAVACADKISWAVPA